MRMKLFSSLVLHRGRLQLGDRMESGTSETAERGLDHTAQSTKTYAGILKERIAYALTAAALL